MIRVVGVRFRTAGKIYFFDPVRFEIQKGDNVIVETARGIEFGTVVGDIREVEDDKVVQPLKPVLRIATERDKEQEAENKLKEREAFKICLEKIRKHELDMKLIDAEYTFDNNKVLFYFTADGRIDFRELVKDLASVFKTRIELRQIGVRDETKTVGGMGICGRVLCCHSYLSDFIPVSIKMAKEQNLSLNPTKISGVCGRLMCCLKHEEETYEELNRKLPAVGDYVTTEDGLKGEVQSVNVLRQLVKVIVEINDEKEIREYETDKLKFKRRHGKKDRQDAVKDELTSEELSMELSREELKALELLEKQEVQEKEERPDRNERSNRGGRSDKGERQERVERTDRTERQERNNRAERSERQERRESIENSERAEGSESSENGEQQGRSERADRRHRRDRRNRHDKNERQDRGNQQEKGDNQAKPEQQERIDRQERTQRAEKGEQSETSGVKNVRSDRGERYGRNRGNRDNRENRQNREDRPNRENRQNREERQNKDDRHNRQEGKPTHNDNRTEA